MSASFAKLGVALDSTLQKANAAAASDPQLQGFISTQAITEKATFGVQAAGSDSIVLIDVAPGTVSMRSGDVKEASFVLSALPEQWQQFFKKDPDVPYQSYWGLVGMNNRQDGIEIKGDMLAFANWASIWRRSLELLHNAYAGPYPEEKQEESDDDVITGRYIVLKDIPLWGRSKVYYETSGNGPVQIVFCHTAGSDCRQYNRVMNDSRMLERCTMYSFDLPAHGKSFPYENYIPGKHTNNEEAFVGCITAFVKKLGLNKPIICGASMAGQISLACAIHADKVGCGGAIPLQGSDHLDMERAWGDQSPFVNQALWNPEWIYGMMAPSAPSVNKQLIWHMYSAQAYGIFHGDLDTKKCPVYMLTGEYDWSNTPAMSQATSEKISGAKHKAMKGLGHFPATENPRVFVGYLLEAIEHITTSRTSNNHTNGTR
ncbi:hypothetical protein FH972_023596 [Carpinus fangiana]|uniref:AB hydrolase-1 domain-containing protein n=1 Tax=Carpinus fangiana TaxID=176857 RepID=A0A5N6KW09_9ROSI|nr:hypothetical protein FH972_023596 [Carpinus fangiana]